MSQPGRTAVYRIFDSSDVLLYVGRRWEQHSSVQPWWPLVHHQTVTWYDTRCEAQAAETAAIRDERPKYNAMPGNLSNGPGVTPGRPVRIESELWAALAAAAGPGRRSIVIRDLIRWFVGETDELPERPARRIEAA